MEPTISLLDEARKELIYPSFFKPAFLDVPSPITIAEIEETKVVFGCKNKPIIMEWDFKRKRVLWEIRLGKSERGIPLCAKRIIPINGQYSAVLDSLNTLRLIDRKKGESISLGELGYDDAGKFLRLPENLQAHFKSLENFRENFCSPLFIQATSGSQKESKTHLANFSSGGILNVGFREENHFSIRLYRLTESEILAFDLKDDNLAIGTSSKEIWLFSLPASSSMEGWTKGRCLLGHSAPVCSIEWIDKILLLSIDKDDTIYIWDTQAGQIVYKYASEKPLQSVHFSEGIFLIAFEDGSLLQTILPRHRRAFWHQLTEMMSLWATYNIKEKNAELIERHSQGVLRLYSQTQDPGVIASGYENGICQGMVIKPSAFVEDQQIKLRSNEELLGQRIDYFRLYKETLKLQREKSDCSDPGVRIPEQVRASEKIQQVKSEKIDFNLHVIPQEALKYLFKKTMGKTIDLEAYPEFLSWFNDWAYAWKEIALQGIATGHLISKMEFQILQIYREKPIDGCLAEMQISISSHSWNDLEVGHIGHVFSMQLLDTGIGKYIVVEEPNYAVWSFSEG